MQSITQKLLIRDEQRQENNISPFLPDNISGAWEVEAFTNRFALGRDDYAIRVH